MDVVLLAEELQEYLEPKILNSYQILDQVSRPHGCEEAYLLGAGVGYKGYLEKIGCTFIDAGITEADHLGVMFRHDRSGIKWQVASGLEQGVVQFYISAIDERNQWDTSEDL